MKAIPPVSFTLFSIAVLLVGMLPTFELPCPIDQGTGMLAAAQGLKIESVELKFVSEKGGYAFGDCADHEKQSKFTYEVSMALTNESVEPIEGTVIVAFNRPSSNQRLGGQVDIEGNREVELDSPPWKSVFVSVPAETSRTVKRLVSFFDRPSEHGEGVVSQPQETLHKGSLEIGKDMPCPTSHGTGQLSFTRWIQVMILK
ncbi:MAG: hypothetical protein CL877_02500 [Dehalococcoidales bacterium]|jgi:hypothetical protein|nr:hypothetical protein [Dehalococcoidales bacterium]MDP7110014.1 hypothetical protein [Dehalococcoidales bacterium]MDP7310212.1 hypothetical protein [Dehalococcoidales bacterium]MDP7409204.1 hypothetical protein [Dehalococcoidales bacterium]MDP7675538.1 hypothetical protein [Dehalococcoidales bacterium]|tara:strand:- start:4370 stop:4972 length:603 start_codon:yes stop_codon:yes gene_type:complete